MLKKRVLKRLLPLLFSFCFVFSGFLSVNAFAYDFDSYGSIPMYQPLEALFMNGGNILYHNNDVLPSSSYKYRFSNPSLSVDELAIIYHDSGNTAGENQVFAVDNSIFDYYIVSSVYGYSTNSNANFTFLPFSFRVSYYGEANNNLFYDISDVKLYHSDLASVKGFSYSAKIDFNNANTIGAIFYNGSTGSVPKELFFECSILCLPKGMSSTDAQQAIVNAINNQTNQLSSDIGQAADDVQQSIEDQYSGDPEEEFSVDDVITQHNEKMGVLSFGSDVMLQFLDMFQSANVGTAELTLPGFNITVENVEYSVWPDYSFNFEQLNEWVPALMSVIRVMLPAFVWLMVLRYCIKVFEDNFLAK